MAAGCHIETTVTSCDKLYQDWYYSFRGKYSDEAILPTHLTIINLTIGQPHPKYKANSARVRTSCTMALREVQLTGMAPDEIKHSTSSVEYGGRQGQQRFPTGLRRFDLSDLFR